MVETLDQAVLDELKSSISKNLDAFKAWSNKYNWFSIGKYNKITISPMSSNKFCLYIYLSGYTYLACLSKNKEFVWVWGTTYHEDLGFDSESAAIACLEEVLGEDQW